MIPGYGCYVNTDVVIKIEPVQAGLTYQVVAWLSDPSPAGARTASAAALTPPIESEAEAMRECERIATDLFNAEGHASWPIPAS